MAKQYVFTEEEFQALREKLELIKHRKVGNHWLTRRGDISESEIETMYGEVFRAFNYQICVFFDQK